MVASNMFVLFVLSKYSWWYKKISAICFRPERFGLISLTDLIRLSLLVKKLVTGEENQKTFYKQRKKIKLFLKMFW